MPLLGRSLLVSIAVLLLSPVELLAQNSSPGAAFHLTVGQHDVVQNLANSSSQAWFDVELRPGRSYCASVLSSQQSLFGAGMTRGDPYVTVYQSDATTWVAYNDNTVTEPSSYLQSRTCFIWPGGIGTYGYIRVTQNTNSANTYDVGIIETTMFCPWFFIGGDYNAFTLIRNTTDSTVNAYIIWRDSTGAIAAWTNVAIAGNGNMALNAKSYVNSAVTSSGSVEITHDASDGALKASTTSLSGTTGIGFDALFETRPK
jgi:hypothetical protein